MSTTALQKARSYSTAVIDVEFRETCRRFTTLILDGSN